MKFKQIRIPHPKALLGRRPVFWAVCAAIVVAGVVSLVAILKQNPEPTPKKETGHRAIFGVKETPKPLSKLDKKFIEPVKQRGGGFAVSSGTVTSQFAPKSSAQTSLVTVTRQQRSVGFRLGGAKEVTVNQVGDTLAYKGVRRATDINYKVTKDYVKEDIILANKSAHPSLNFKAELPEGYTAKKDDVGGLVIQNGDDKLFYIQPPTATDATGKVIPYEYHFGVSGRTLDLVLSPVDVAAYQNAVFPVTVDPTVSWGFTSASDYTVSDASKIEVAGGVAKLIQTGGVYPSDNPYVTTNTPFYFSSLSSFAETLGAGNQGSVKYMFSSDLTNWCYWDSASWNCAGTGYDTANDAATVNTNVAALSTLKTPGPLYVRAFLHSDGSQQVELDNISFGYTARTISWTGASTTDWATAGNWNPAAVPTQYDDVVIQANTRLPILDLVSGSVTVNSLVLGGTATTVSLTLKNATTDHKLIVTSDVTIGSSGTLYQSNGPAEMINLDVGGNFNLTSSGAIRVNGYGYPQNDGPGKGTASSGFGGGHGGNGYLTTATDGLTYDSVTQPSMPGSGGGTSSGGQAGGVGGGVIKITVAGTFTHSSSGGIVADGTQPNSLGGGGAGGSIWISANAFSGTGSIRALGGSFNNSTGGGGGGGRIAIYSNSSLPTNLLVYGGTATNRGGGAGTIYTKTTAQTYGNLKVQGLTGNYPNMGSTTQVGASETYDLVSMDQAMYVVPSGKTLTVNDLTEYPSDRNRKITTDSGGVLDVSSTSTMQGYDIVNNGTFTFNNLTVSNEAFNNNGIMNGTATSFTWNGSTIFTQAATGTFPNTNLTVSAGTFNFNSATATAPQSLTALTVNGGTLTQTANVNQNGPATPKILNFNVSGAVAVTSGSISVSSRGHSSSYGTGSPGTWTCPGTPCYSGGGGYGGVGGPGYYTAPSQAGAGGITYGNQTAPADIGSAGASVTVGGSTYAYGGIGGGAVKIVSATSITVSSSITADGGNASLGASVYGGGGSGGSIWLAAPTVTGSGTLSANGGTGAGSSATAAAGGGGGGRINITTNAPVVDSMIPSSGSTAGGDTVEFVGSNFTASTTVKFADASGTVTYNSSSSISAITPAATKPGKVDVTLENPGSSNFGGTVNVNGGTSLHSGSEGGTGTINTANKLALIRAFTYAGSINWVGGTSTDWATPSNWDAVRLPNSGDDVLIDGGTNQPTLDLTGGSATVRSLMLGDSTSSTLTLSNSGDANKLITTADLGIGSYGTITSTANSTAQTHKVVIDVGGSANIASTGKIDVNGRGFAASQGTGAGTSGGCTAGSGAGYGGVGKEYSTCAGGTVYGSPTQPTDIGSGGATYTSYVGGAGGGAVKLAVTGTFGLSGSISANGAQGVSSKSGGGSGGSIWLSANAYTGSGTLSAVGGSGTSSAAGGGGRIAVYSSSTAPSYTISAGGTAGGAGTIFTKSSGDTNGNLLVNNAAQATTAYTNQVGASETYDSFTVTNGAVYNLPSGKTINAGSIGAAAGTTTSTRGTINIASGGALNMAAATAMQNYYVTNAGTWTLGTVNITGGTHTNNNTMSGTAITFTSATAANNGTLTTNALTLSSTPYTGTMPNTNLTLSGSTILTFSNQSPSTSQSLQSLTMTGTSRITHTANGTTPAYSINLNVSGNVSIGSGTQINVAGLGLTSGYGSGSPGTQSVANYAGFTGGAGYANAGGQGYEKYGDVVSGGAAYGSSTAPADVGSGGGTCNENGSIYAVGGTGGGAVKIASGGSITVDGSITASGGNGTYNSGCGGGGGSGGSIWLAASSVTGSGTLNVAGGNGYCSPSDCSYSGGGGGSAGRISLSSTSYPTITSVVPNYGQKVGGDSVTITGTNFNSSTQVKFGSTLGTVTYYDSTTLIVTVPASASIGLTNVTVLDPTNLFTGTLTTTVGDGVYDGGVASVNPTPVGGQTGAIYTLVNGFTYYQIPTITSVSPNVGVVSGGTSVTITGTNFDTSSVVTFGGTTATRTVNSATQITATAPAHAPGPVDVVVTNGGVSSATSTNGFTYVPVYAITSTALNLAATEPGQITVQQRDGGGNPLSASVDFTLTLTSSSAGGAFARDLNEDPSTRWTYSSVVIPAGQTSASFYYKDTIKGTPTVTVRSQANVNYTQQENISSKFRLHVTGVSDPIQAGTPSSVTVQAVDYAGNPLTDYTGTINFTSTDAAAIKPANFTFTSGMHGIHTFVNGITMGTPGEWCMTATDTLDSVITGSQCSITVETAATGTISKLAVITPPQSFPTTSHSSAITVQTQDSSGTAIPVAGNTTIYVYSSSSTRQFSLDGETGWSSAVPYTITIPAGASSANVYYKDVTAGSPTLTFREDVGTGQDFGWTNATQDVTVGVGAASKLTMTTITASAGAYTAVTVTLRDSNDVAVTTLEDLPVYLTSTSGTSRFSLSPDGSGYANTLTTRIPAASTQTTFYFTDTTATTLTITASDASPADGVTGLADATQETTVQGGAVTSLAFTGVASQQVGEYGELAVTLHDIYGNVAPAASDTTVTFATDTTYGSFHVSEGGASTGARVISSGATTATVYYRDIRPGTAHLTASTTGLDPQNHNVVLSTAPLSSLRFNPNSQTITAGSPSSVISIESTDAYGNLVNAGTDINLTLSNTNEELGGIPGGGTFSLSNSDWQPITTATISAGSNSVQVYYKNTTTGTFTLAADDGGALPNPSGTITVQPDAYNKLVILSGPSSATVTEGTTAFTVATEDVYGNFVTFGGNTTLYLYSSSVGGAFSTSHTGPWNENHVTIPAGSSTAEFYYLDSVVGHPTITVSDQTPLDSPDTGVVNATANININDLPPHHLAITTTEQTVTAGTVSGAITVEARKVDDVPAILSSSMTINLSSALLSGTAGTTKFTATHNAGAPGITSVTIPADGSSVTFYYVDTGTGTKRLTTTSTTPGVSATSQDITIESGPASMFQFTTAPQTIRANYVSEQIRVEVADAYGNSTTLTSPTTVTLGSACGTGEFSLTPTPTWSAITAINLAAGSQDMYFYYRDSATGTCTLSASADSFTTGTQLMEVLPPPSRIVFINDARTIERGQAPASYTIGLVDSDGNAATSPTATSIYLSSTSPSGVFYDDIVIIPADTSSATFTYNDWTVGTPTITAADQTTGPDVGLLDATQGATVAAGNPTRIVLEPANSSQQAGQKGYFTVELVNQYGYTTYAQSDINVTLATTAGTGTFYYPTSADVLNPRTVTISAGQSGFDFWYSQTAAYTEATLTASATGLTSDTATVTLLPANAYQLKLTGAAGPFIAGQSTTVTVTVQDQYGNAVEVNGDLIIHLHTTSSTASMPSTRTISADNSSTSFVYTDTSPGSATLTASDYPFPDDPNQGLVNDTLGMTYNIGAPSILQVVTETPTAQAGVRTKVDISITNAYGISTVATENMDINLSTDAGSGQFFAASEGGSPITTVTMTTGDSTVSVWYRQTGAATNTLTASRTGMTSGFDTITILAGAPVSLNIVASPTTIMFGQTSSVAIYQRDIYGNPAVSAQDVHLYLSTNSPTAALASTATIRAGSTHANLTFSDSTAGNWQINAADNPLPDSPDQGLTNATQQMEVIVGDPYRLVFENVPSSFERGGTAAMKVVVKNLHGASVPATSDITAYLDTSGSTGQFGSTATGPWGISSVSIPTGYEEADVYYRDNSTLGVAHLAVSDVSSPPEEPDTGLYNGSADTTVIAGQVVQLAFVTTPTDVVATHPSEVMTVEARNYYGMPVEMTSDTRIYLNAVGGQLNEFSPIGGPWGVNFVIIPKDSSRVSFLFRSQTEGAKTITASDMTPVTPDAGWTNATQSINVVRQTMDHFLVTNISTPQNQGTPSSVVVVAMDSGDYPISWYDGTITFSSSDPTHTYLPSSYTFVPATDHGTHTFTNGVGFSQPGTKTVTATDTAGKTGAQTGIVVNGVSAAAAGKLAFTSPTARLEVAKDGVSEIITLQSQDLSSAPVNAGAGGLAVRVTTTSTGGQFATSASGPWQSAANLTIPEGYSFVNLYYRDSVAGAATITATDWQGGADNPSITNATLPVSVGTFFLASNVSIQSRNYTGALVSSPYLFAVNEQGNASGVATSAFAARDSAVTSTPFSVSWETTLRNGAGTLLHQQTSAAASDIAYAPSELVAQAGAAPFVITSTATRDTVSHDATVQVPVSPWTAYLAVDDTVTEGDNVVVQLQTRSGATLADVSNFSVSLLASDMSSLGVSVPMAQAQRTGVGLYGITFNSSDFTVGSNYLFLVQLQDVSGNTAAEDVSGAVTIAAAPQPEPEPEPEPESVTPVVTTETPTTPPTTPPATPPTTPKKPAKRAPSAKVATAAAATTSNNPIVRIAQFIKPILTSPATPVVFPVVILVLIAFMAVILLWQIYREIHHARAMTAILRREQETAHDKENFLQLGAHFLRTPITIVAGASQLLQSMPEIAADIKQKLAAISTDLQQTVESIVSRTEHDRGLSKIVAPDMPKATRKIYLSPLFWLPIALSVGLTLLLNILIVTIGGQKLTNFAMVEQALVIGLVVLMLYAVLRERQMTVARNKELKVQLDARTALDNAKNEFIQQTRDSLEAKVKTLSALRKEIPAYAPVTKNMLEGIDRLEQLVEKFTILSGIRSGKVSTAHISSSQLIDSSFATANAKITAKGLKITKSGADIALVQDPLLGQVVSSVLDNAAEFSVQGGEIAIANYQQDGHTVIRVANQGAGFARDPQELFGLFERGDEATDFTHAGMGLSLYLDLLIMRHIGGAIAARNISGGAEVILTIPQTI